MPPGGAVQNPESDGGRVCKRDPPTPMAEFTTFTLSQEAPDVKILMRLYQRSMVRVLMPGDKFSCLEHMLPFTAENGYFPAWGLIWVVCLWTVAEWVSVRCLPLSL